MGLFYLSYGARGLTVDRDASHLAPTLAAEVPNQLATDQGREHAFFPHLNVVAAPWKQNMSVEGFRWGLL